MKAEGNAIPANVVKMLSSGASSFYRRRDGAVEFFDFASGGYLPVPVSPNIVSLPSLAERKKVVRRNAGASLYDLGDGVLCVEFHTKMNTIDADIASMLMEGVDLAEREFAGLVIANHAENFCVGANLMLVFLEAQNKQFGNIETMVKGFQDACMRLRHRDVPWRRPDPRGGRDVHGTGRGGRGAAPRRRGFEGDDDPLPRGDPGWSRRGPATVPAPGSYT